MRHSEQSPLAGHTVRIKPDSSSIGGREILIEDWWDRVSGKSWQRCTDNAACIEYILRHALFTMKTSICDVPSDDEVLYGKIDSFGFLIHISEIVEEDIPVQSKEPEFGQWISMKDQKPKDQQKVIYYFDICGINIGVYTHEVEDGEEYDCFYGANGFLTDDVTHWMPMPKPPNENNK